ncbi:MAG: hypothetical protein H7317_03140, partial [Pseudorhodobacter sp.]|nr:hypothetical protein [Pseudorhodobacter sp.]
IILRYEGFVGHYGMEASRNNRGEAHENGAVESQNRHLKTAIAQALILRGNRDFASIADYRRFVDLLVALADRPGVTATIVPDPTNNPLDRLKVTIDPGAARITAWNLAMRLATGERPVIVRDHEIEHGHFFLDPCNLHPPEEHVVAQRLVEELEKATRSNDVIGTPIREVWLAREQAVLNWPDI